MQLFVADSKKHPEQLCSGSMVCVQLVERLRGAGVDVAVMDANGDDAPPGLIGTPTVVDADGAAHVGFAAFECLLDALVVHLSAARPAPTAKAARPAAGGSAPVSAAGRNELSARRSMQPVLQLNDGKKKNSLVSDEAGFGGDDDGSSHDAWPDEQEQCADDEGAHDDKPINGDDLQRAMNARKSTTSVAGPNKAEPKITQEAD